MIRAVLGARRSIAGPLGQGGGGGLAAYSLEYDGGDDTDCGNDPTIMDLHQSDMTGGCWWRCPNLASLADFSRYGIVTQGSVLLGSTADNGWSLWLNTGTLPAASFIFSIVDGGGLRRWTFVSLVLVSDTWYFVWWRRAGNTIYISVNAGVETNGVTGAGGTVAACNLYHGRFGTVDATYLRMIGHLCYVHLWNNNQGAIGAVPTSPIALGANTAGRWRHSDGAGGTLTDDSGNGNNGIITGAQWSTTVPPTWSL